MPSEFIEITDGVMVKRSDIECVIDNKDGTVVVKTAFNAFEVQADFSLLMAELDEETRKEQEIQKLTKQYFGG